MDLLQTVRKEGSRGGVNFSWDDVKDSQHRENYLGHSLMAPVGRWQKGKDLGWYAKGDDAELTPEQRTEKEREAKKEEMRKVKEAEEDAMARALGLPVPDRSGGSGNANEEPLGLSKERQKEVNKALKEALDDGENEGQERGVGFGSYGGGDGDGSGGIGETGVGAEIGGDGMVKRTIELQSVGGGRDQGLEIETGNGGRGTDITNVQDRAQKKEGADLDLEVETEDGTAKFGGGEDSMRNLWPDERSIAEEIETEAGPAHHTRGDGIVTSSEIERCQRVRY